MRRVVRRADDLHGSSFQESMAPAANHDGDRPLGELIARSGLVASNDLYAALATSRATRRRLGDVLLDQGLIGERDLAQLVAEQEGLDFIDLGKFDLDQKAVDLLSERTSRKHRAIAFRSEGAATVVAVADPTDNDGLDAIVAEVPGGVRFVVATASEVGAALAEAFGERPPEGW
jgi:type IV pilus assembly protein PilB